MTTPYPFTPWYVSGWTAQQPYPSIADVVIVGENQLPNNINQITVTGKYVRITGWAAGGAVKFTLLGPSVDSTSHDVILPGVIIGYIRDGVLEGLTTGSALKIPAGFTYKVREIAPGGRTFSTTIAGSTTGTLDINTLVPA